MRWLSLLLLPLLALPHQGYSQVVFPSSKPTNSIVTILSDGISEPNSPATQILGEISLTLDKESDLRVLAVNGYGGAVNIRDLLQLRGADLAVVNNDVLAYLDLAKTLPEARRRVRLVAPLYHQTVLLFGRETVKSIDDLKGRKVGVSADRPSRGVTAKTILGLLKIDAEVIELEDKELARRASQDLDALLLFEGDLRGYKASGVFPSTYHPVSIPPDGALAKAYLPKRKSAADGADAFQSVQVSTLLVAFDWNARQGRYPDVVAFVDKFFALLPAMRSRFPNSPLSATDVRVTIPGWQRFGPAESLAAGAAPPPVPRAEAQIENQPLSLSDSLKVAVVSRPPLTSRGREDGGVALKLFTDALAAAGIPVAVQWVDGERMLLDSLLASKTADIGLFWQSPNCDAPREPSATEAALCDMTSVSEPLMQVTLGVFTRLDWALDPKNADADQRTLCIPESQTVPAEAVSAIAWMEASTAKIIRPRTLIDCLAAVDRRDANGLIAIEPEGRFTIEKLKLSQTLQLSQRLGATVGLHAVVAKENADQAKILQKINDALTKLRSSDRFAAIMTSHLADLTGTSPAP
jgi:ABC-type amino acid transport substrate-binding protein